MQGPRAVAVFRPGVYFHRPVPAGVRSGDGDLDLHATVGRQRQRDVQRQFLDPPAPGPVPGHPEMRALLSVNGLILLILGIFPQPLLALCYIAINSL